MPRIKPVWTATLRWGWFVLLVLLAFGYLAAGLSQRSIQSTTESLPTVAPLGGLSAVENAIVQSWNDQGIAHAEVADWLTVCRRMSLGVVGSGLSLEEIRHLQSLPEAAREAAHLESLLKDSRFHYYWSERWARFLVGAEEGPFLVYRRRRFRIWLQEQFAQDRRYDEIVRRLVTAEGLWTDRPEVNFLTVTFDSNDGQPDPVRLAARTSRAFLGLRIDCLQCHDDFLGNVSLGDIESPREGMQTDFHQLAAFYSAAKTNGLQGVQENDADYHYQYLDETEEVAVEPAVPYSPELLPTEGSSRERLAAWITHPENRQAARAAVSHVWALLFGRSATESVDNLPLDETSPQPIEALTDEFLRSDYDLRHLIRLIVKSSAFRVSSRATFEITSDHEDRYAVFPLTRLRPEQVAACVIQSSRIKKIDRDSSLLTQIQKFGGMNDFVERYGDIGEDEFSNDSVTITQRLVMLNGDMLAESIGDNPIMNASTQIEMFAPDDKMAIETTYLCVLNRLPTEEEQAHFAERISGSDSRREAIEDLFWILLNSTELAWNH
ncbi:DUF1553 domain-containing protein [Novipirellula artificiosorum]|uniref:Cytochrome c domain-containing protein n=1 Tax=Novipirellula artificiosorum TaxID=2528016 RepID=A0A5C6D3H4_9BACT|nr:DUF1553 domain-containing protein [Novipirellula artificiosorum]TWU31763.1 hypothetical protein Poly41_59980 [Novipirellula artificiosorum]